MSHIEKKEFEIYRISPPPPKWDLQECIRQYIQSGDDKYFYWFLHYYEPTLNEKAKSFRNKYSMEEHFADIKQSLVTGLCKALVNYDISIAPLFCRMLRGIWSVSCITISAQCGRAIPCKVNLNTPGSVK